MSTVERLRGGASTATSHGQIVTLISDADGLTRQQLLVATGMSRATLFERLEALIAAGYVYEAETLGTTGGRRARLLRFDNRGRVILTMALGQTHATVSVVTTEGVVLRERTRHHVISDEPESVLWPLTEIGRELLAGHDSERFDTERFDSERFDSERFDSERFDSERLIGIGVSLPTPVESATGFVSHSTTIPTWPADAVVRAISRSWDVPLVVENDARAAALGESRKAVETLVYVKIATGIGCGIVVDGTIMHGAHGAAGDIGHIHIEDDGPTCRCGRTGCLAALSSGWALIEQLDDPRIRTVDELVTTDSRAASRAVTHAADVLGRALAATVTTVNPDRLVLGGTVGLMPAFTEQVRSRVLRDVVDRIAAGLTIEAGLPRDEAATRGLVRLVMASVFSPASIDSAARAVQV